MKINYYHMGKGMATMRIKCFMKFNFACIIVGASFSSNAALVTGDVLEYDTRQTCCVSGWTYPD